MLSGKSSSSLDLDATTEGDAGTYSVVVMGACNTITNSAALTVNLPLIVSRPPSNANVCSGTSARFQIDATGTGLTYQWYKGATMLVGQTASILTLDNLSPLDAAIFKVVVNGPCGGSVTNVAELTVNQPTAVVQPLANVTNCPGANAIFSAGALGSGLSYQWYRGTTLLNGQTNATVNLSNLQPSDSDNYSVVVSSVCGSSVTVSARLSVRQPALVVSPPRNATNCPGANVSFSMDATGSDLTYQWYQENTLLVGQTNSTLNLQNILATDAGNYKVVVTGFCGRSITNSAILAVNQPMLLVNPPISITNCPGANLTFSVGATGSGLNYQWFRGSTLLIAQTNAFLGLQNITAADAGIYSVVVSGACGDALTNAAFLSVNQPALVVNPPTNVTNCPGANVTFSVGAIGTGLSYQWYRGNTLLFGKTNATLNLPNITAADGGNYALVVTGACGNGITNSTSLAVNQPALVVNPPASVTNCPGANVTLSVGATGTRLNFQWFRGSTLLIGQTNASLGLQNITAADAGIYGVVVTGICGGAVTNSAVLSVNQPALVVNPPVNVTNCLGANAVFRVSATGTSLRYQWYRSNTMLIGETNAALSLPSISDLDAGRYSVVVTGVCGGTITNSANLVVNQPALVVNPPANVTNCPGANVTFSVGATGTGLNYQWLRGSILLIGQTNASLGLQNITAADAGNYSVIVIGACGGPLTNNVFLSVNQPALVVNPPTNVTNCPGANVTFSVGATGTD